MFWRALSPAVSVTLFAVVCFSAPVVADVQVDSLAREYVKLVLRAGRYIPDYVDSYYGPAELKDDAAGKEVEKGFPYDKLWQDTDRLMARIREVSLSPSSESSMRRMSFMHGQLTSLRSVLNRHKGKRLKFDEEAPAIFGVHAPQHDSAYYEVRLAGLDSLLPGKGDLRQRFLKLQDKFVVPPSRIDTLIKLCLAECRARTSRYLELPRGEKCTVELVGAQAWGGYNWYLGDFQSLIQIDTTTKVYIGSLIGLAAHEGYPGHHCNNIVREKHLVRDSGWVEYSVYPLFSPISVLEEGMANYGVDMVFPAADRVEFYQNTLFPLAGIDPSSAMNYSRVLDALDNLDAAELDAARLYLDDLRDTAQTIAWLGRYRLEDAEEAARAITFFEKYGSYIVTYTVGKQLVRDYEARHGGTLENPAKCWGIFHSLMTMPAMPSDLD